MAKPILILMPLLLAISAVSLKGSDLCSNRQNLPAIPFLLTNGGIVIPVQINDHANALNFLLDTGDEKTIIDKQLAKKLRLPIESAVSVLRPEAEVSASLVRVKSLQVGSVTFDGQSVVSYDQAALSRTIGVPIDGTLGLDVLEQLRFKINYSDKTFTPCPATDSSEDAAEVAVPLMRSGLSVLVPVIINGSTQGKLFLDTGNNFTTLTWNLWQRITEKWHPRAMISGVRSAGEGTPQSYLTRLDSFQIGKVLLSRPSVLVIRPQTSGTLAQAGAFGLLGQDILKQFIITIDVPNHQLYLHSDRKYQMDPLRYTTVGIQFYSNGGNFVVASVWDGSPGSEAGIRPGDQILRIDGKRLDPSVLGSRAGHLLHRPEGTKIRLQVRRETKTFEAVLVCRNLLP